MFKLLTKRSFSLGLTAVAVAVVTGCGGGSSGSVATPTPTPTATTLLSVTPVLGAVYGGTVNVYSSTGTLLGTATTSNTDGKASVSLSNYTAGSPVIIKVSLGAGASYFNEKTGINVNVTNANPISLLSVLPTVGTGQSVGVTPITNMAAKLAGLTPNAVGSGTLATTVTADSIYTAVAKTNLALGLPASTNILAAPVAATVTAPIPTEPLGQILAVMAKNTIAADPAAQAAAMAAAVKTDGTVDLANKVGITEVNATLTNPTIARTLSIVVAPSVLEATASQITTATTASKSVAGKGTATSPTGAGG
jgi:hypothetical protein